MASRSPTIIDRADEVDTDLVPEPWDDRDAAEDQEIVTRRERYRLQGVTDGQGAGIVPAYNLNVADTGSIASKTKDGWSRASAGRVLGPNGKYVSRGSDVPRLSFDGDEAGLLVEAPPRTNHVPYSSAIDDTNWTANNDIDTGSITSKTSIIDGETAYEIPGDGTSGGAHMRISAGTFTGSDEVAYVKVEEGSSDLIALVIKNTTSGNVVSYVEYEWSTDSTTVEAGSTAGVQVRAVQQNGPNGNKLVQFLIRYAGGNAENVNGENRIFRIHPDRNSNANSVICHHAQIEEAPNASSPIVTQGSPVTRSGDDYAIFEGGQPPWWNPNEGTLIVDFTILVYNIPFDKGIIGTHDDDEGWISIRNSSKNRKIGVLDSSDFLRVDGWSPFQQVSVGVSDDGLRKRLSVDGNSDSSSSGGNLLSVTELDLGDTDGVRKPIVRFGSVYYIPRALSESTLNRITS